MRLPNRWIRRFLIWPLPVLIFAVYVTTVPLLVIAALLISYRLPGKLRAVRSLGLATIYLFVEAAAVIIGLVLWVASGFGWKLRSSAFVAAHYTVLRVALGPPRRSRRFVLAPTRSHVMAGPPTPNRGQELAAARSDDRPLFESPAQWFISPKPGSGDGTIDAIGTLADGMTKLDALIIFPEGGNFTPERRLRAIDRLRSGGCKAAAERAERLRNVLPPRPAGSRAALAAASQADAVFVAHTGLDTIATVSDLWFAIPTNKTIHLNWYVVPSNAIPRNQAAQEDMLFKAWETIDVWIEENRRSLQP